MHRTLKQEATKPARRTLQSQQKVFGVFRNEDNHERPHEALSNETPASVFTPSIRPYTATPEPFSYPSDCTLKVLQNAGRFRWKGNLVTVGAALEDEVVAVQEIEDGQWRVMFGPLTLGTVDATAYHLGLIRC